MKAFIFDFDGVIVDSELHWDKDALGFYQTLIPSFTREEDKTLKGRNVQDIYKMLSSRFDPPLTLEEYLEKMDVFAGHIYEEKTKLLPGIPELLTRLQSRGIPIGIASSGVRKWIDIILERYNLGDAFPVIVMAADVGIGKPDPAVFRGAADALEIPPEECCALEDSTNGITSAKAAGMTCIALQHGPEYYQQDLSQADHIVKSIGEIDDGFLTELGFR